MFGFLIVALIVLAIVGLAVQLSGQNAKRRSGPSDLPYSKVDSVVTATELKFYQVLAQVCGNKYLISTKMRLKDLVDIDASGDRWQAAFNRVSQKHVDFVVLAPHNLMPILVIELDDASHQRAVRQERDELVDDIFATVGLGILHVPVAGTYDPNVIIGAINQEIVRLNAAAARG